MIKYYECADPDAANVVSLAVGGSCHHPFVLRGFLNEWGKWTKEELRDISGSLQTGCRFFPRHKDEGASRVQFETDSLHLVVTVNDFITWSEGEGKSIIPVTAHSRILASLNPTEWWGYIDYKHFPVLFSSPSSLSQAASKINWRSIGIPSDGESSTIWIGTQGAYTPTHYDTYGHNFVAQFVGRKRWLLVSPDFSEGLYPTRLPYEESSVFSKVQIKDPDYSQHPRFKDVNVIEVVLQPGEVLYVPSKWWHFVETLDSFSVSINTWLHNDSEGKDKVARVSEALVRLIVTAIKSYEEVQYKDDDDDEGRQWVNPTEEIHPHDYNVDLLIEAIRNAKGDVGNIDRVELTDRVVNSIVSSPALDAILSSILR
jgi:HSPB1-associated protein 1